MFLDLDTIAQIGNLGKFVLSILCMRTKICEFIRIDLPKVGEPLDELRCVVLVELDVGKVHLEDGRGRIPHPEEHQLGFPQMHGCQRRRVHCG
ncbi:hypothetical protein TKK_0009606 [Trichogramma kaykai]